MTRTEGLWVGVVVCLAVVLVLTTPAIPAAHEIPSDVTVRAFVKPEGDRLRLLVRVPLEAMQDFNFPQRGRGYLDLARADRLLRDAAIVWIADSIELFEGGVPLGEGRIVAIRVSLPSDRSFGTYDDAVAHVTGAPLAADTQLPWQQAMLDVMFEYAIGDDRSDYAIEPALGRLGLRTTTVLRFVTPDGIDRPFQYTGNPGLVRLDPRWHQAAWRFIQLGFEHILDGIDHLLFLLCLVIPFRRLRPLIPIVTSFTVAHSITLIASAFGLAPNALWFPPLIETLIALSIVYMALENIVGAKLERRWLIAFGFGLVHGFGFSFALSETLQFAGAHLLTSLLSFNVGVEIGQLFVLALAVPVLDLVFRRAVTERIGTILLSALLAHTAWHWMSERGAQLVEYRVRWPAWDRALLADTMRWALLVLVLGAAVWLLLTLFGRFVEPLADGDAAATADE